MEEACRESIKNFQPMQPGDVVATAADTQVEDFDFKPSTPVDLGISRFAKWFRDFMEFNDIRSLKKLACH